MKLTRGKLLEIIRKKQEGWTTYQARKIANISIRRVNHVWKIYLKQKIFLKLANRMEGLLCQQKNGKS